MSDLKRLGRAPRRRVVRERQECRPVPGGWLTQIVCDLECGHTVEGVAGWGRRTCRHCGKEASDG